MPEGSSILLEVELKEINRYLSELLWRSQAMFALLVDSGGQLITSQGVAGRYDYTALASLSAGNFVATSSLARLLGQKEFTVLLHQGKKINIHIASVESNTILVVVFDKASLLGGVKMYVKKTIEKMVPILRRSRFAPPEEKVVLDEDFLTSVREEIDRLFTD